MKIKLIYAGNLHITTLQRLHYQMLIFETDSCLRYLIVIAGTN
ncbi:hypothetical protein SALWKB2_0556 [Snodgrassella alvi wkB2]|nr:hypothetical protein SALWKB2_0556 [Snodgrassella alvi wkB2]